jgi:hypothetical protein
LSRTLPELFWVTLPSYTGVDDDEKVTISDLGISSSDIDKIRAIALFPEDSADLLFYISLGYLLQVDISDDTFSIILDYLARILGLSNLPKMFVSTAKVSDTPIFSDIQTALIEAFRAQQFSPKRLALKLVADAAICQSALKIDPPSATKIDPPQAVVFSF